ncbi:hypothetical protein GJU40_12255 [Bacillus lacus]|uniref:Uncharacterized protein n=1 Tax=Metabacillus lacus TaxID=1983721 RepID=A0A7X2J1F9_9BACI|nr:hypothetical protein [Metabacillus lacus]MRX72913.1 hypothetical protein [Metabacillus lacus]
MFQWGKNFPFGSNSQGGMFQNGNAADVEDYIQQVMTQVFGQPVSTDTKASHVKNTRTSKAEPEIFETSQHIYMKVPADQDTAQSLLIRHSSYKVELANYPDAGKTASYSLPSLVKRKGTKVSRHDGYIEIAFSKIDDPLSTEIQIFPQNKEDH